MAETKVIMPQMGESIFEGTITKWLKKAGDRVERDEPLFEISTDKVDSEIPAPASGVVQEIIVKEGQTVQINTVVAVIGDGAAKPAEPKTSSTAGQPGIAPGPAPIDGPVAKEQAKPQQQPAEVQPQPQPQPVGAIGGGGQRDFRSSPLVRRIAREHNISLNGLAGKGTGINGRITKRDILSYIEQGAPAAPSTTPAKPAPTAPAAPATPAAPPAAAPPKPATPAPQPMTFSGDVERVPMTAMRKFSESRPGSGLISGSVPCGSTQLRASSGSR